MSHLKSRCPHVAYIGNTSWEDINRAQKENSCDTCGVYGPNLWICLHSDCMVIGCGETASDHSTKHNEAARHCLTLNLTTKRVWCYSCETEVIRTNNEPPFVMRERSVTDTSSTPTPDNSLLKNSSQLAEEISESDEEDDDAKPRGLTGLKNIGNTCYMNSALQALSNCPPLTQFFLDCYGFVRTEKKPGLSKSYLRLMAEIWHRDRPSFIVPSSIVHGIKVVHPMFRGYTQQDTQEFLRCFMDQIHEELKQPITEFENEDVIHHIANRQMSVDSSESSSSTPTEGDYETCESGVNSDQGSAEPNDESISMGTSAQSERPECDTQMNENLSQDIDDGDVSLNSADGINDQARHNNGDTPGDVPNAAEAIEIRSDANNEDAGQRSSRTKRSSKGQGGKVDQGKQSSSTKPQKTQAAKQRDVQGQKKAARYSSVISDVFDGKLLSSVQCLTCERVSSTRETFQDLSLPIPSKDHLYMLHNSQTSRTMIKGACGEVNPGWMGWMWSWVRRWFWGPAVQLDDCLAAFFSEDELKGDNMYSCETCKKLRNGMKYSKVLELPEIVCIHLKRFRHEFMFSTKISSHVSFPLEGLDLSPYLHKDFKGQVTVYDVVAVICHHGTAGGGHYTAYALNNYNASWYEFDDRVVTEVMPHQVENCEAYVLFYRKRNEEVVKQRQKAMQLLECQEPSFMKFYVSKQWINKFNTFAEPGPIANGDFLCKHGGVPPSKMSYVDQMVTTLPQPVWEYLHKCYGGGPAVNHLGPCKTCQQEIDTLRKRQKQEMDTFVELNKRFQAEEQPSVIYGISMIWFKYWETFVREKDDTIPGPIDNKPIAVMRPGGHFGVKQSSDYGQLSKEMWRFLHEIYGGGPEAILKQSSQTGEQKSSDSGQKEVQQVEDGK